MSEKQRKQRQPKAVVVQQLIEIDTPANSTGWVDCIEFYSTASAMAWIAESGEVGLTYRAVTVHHEVAVALVKTEKRRLV